MGNGRKPDPAILRERIKTAFCCKSLSLNKMMTLFKKEAPANSVPAAAVIQEGQVLFFVIRRKGFVGYLIS